MVFSADRICRTCMAESSTLMPIWPATNRIAAIDPSSSITMMLKSFTTIDATLGDGLPANLCITCISELNRAYSFKQKCERSEYTLRMYLQAAKSDDDDHRAAAAEPVDHSERDGTPADDAVVAVPAKKNVIIMFANTNKVTEPADVASTETSLVYQCSSCTATFLSYEMLKQHLVVQHQAVHCEPCNMYFNAEAYAAHITAHDMNEEVWTTRPDRKYACEMCSLDFAKKQVFDEHCLKYHMVEEPFEVLADVDGDDEEEIAYDHYDGLDTVVEEADGQSATVVATAVEEHPDTDAAGVVIEDPPGAAAKFYCGWCNAAFAKQLSLNIHFNSKKCMQKLFECDICARVFAKKKNLSAHMKVHTTPSDRECSLCDVIFSDGGADDRAEHMEKMHSKTKKFKCNICPKSFGMSSTLKDHMRTHSGERPYLCSICGKGFSQNANLKQHVMRHNKLKPFRCGDCDQAFVSKGELDTHQRKHTGQHPFVCNVCGSGFTTSSSMGKHKRIHTGERPYACEHCPMRFSALATLKNHRRTHTGERPFKCTHCIRSFTQKSDCVSHMRTHTGDRPFSCTECHQAFSHGSSLRSHQRVHRKAAKVLVQPEKSIECADRNESLIDIN